MVGFEEAMRITDEVAPFSVVSVLCLDGSLPVATLRAALDALQQRHPLLRARIVGDGKGHVYQFDSAGPIPLETVERSHRDQWIAATEEELHRRIDYAVGPLMRCRYLVDKDGGDVILTIPHNILDAACAAPLLSEFLALCAGRTPASTATPDEGRVAPPSLYPPEYTGLRFARAVAANMAHQMADEMKFRWNSRGVRKAPILPIDKGHCRILPIQVPAPLTASLVQATRRERVTLNAILSAAMLAAVQRNLYPSPRVPLRHIIFTDMRPRLRTTVPSANLGCFLSLFRFTVLVEADGAFWDLARQIQKLTLRAAHSGERYLANSMSPDMMKMIFRMKAFRMGATAVSYAGALDFVVTGASFTVSSVHAFAANMTLGPEYSGLVRLFRGELCWDLLYLDSDMDAALATRIADDILTILERATC
jgi:hypothetical protein